MKIAVIGSGSWGTTLANHLCGKGNDVFLWTRDPAVAEEICRLHTHQKYLPGAVLHDRLKATTDAEKALRRAEVVVLAIPSQSMRMVLTSLAPSIPADAVLVNVAKGIEVGSLARMEEVVSDCLPSHPYATLSGPSHAEEVVRGVPTTLVAASHKQETARLVQDLFMNPSMRVYTNPDLIGVELGGALKNVLALGIGILDGLEYGDNTRAAMLTRGLFEMTRLGVALGARRETFSGLTGMGDLIVTATSSLSRNHRAGVLLGKGNTLEETLAEIGMVVEGVMTTKSAWQLAVQSKVEIPITNELYALLFEKKSADACVRDLMQRDRRTEMEPLLQSSDFAE